MHDIVDTAVAAGPFKTLVAAVQAAGLVETLKGAGPFTVFAPTDDAFGKLPEDVVAGLLKPENQAKLQSVLTYHVVSGKVMASDVVKLKSAKSLQGQELTIDTNDGVKIDGANVVQTDIACSNGVIHIIDCVVLPK
ncbi:MAG: fasciclin domain-containing protein [Planctomycetia bacterium]|nr:fasciclin domain-containing protein [Planctomycetia bacterium]